MKIHNFTLLLCALLTTALSAHEFQRNDTITPAEIEQMQQSWNATFTMNDHTLHFVYDSGAASCAIEIPATTFEQLPLEDKNRFVKTESGYRYCCGDVIDHNNAQTPDDDGTSYYLAEPRRFAELQKPVTISVHELADMITKQRVVFYTGAGISIAGGVHGMAALMDALCIDPRNHHTFIRHALSNHNELLAEFKKFCCAAFCNAPTPAHYALTELMRHSRASLITENFDLLHHRTGVKPYCADAEKFKKEVTQEQLQAVDAVICIGLSHDDRGFLAWYKEHHPAGTIVSIDLLQPHYLGDEDRFAQGDLQQILPALRDIIACKEPVSNVGDSLKAQSPRVVF